MGVHGLWRLIEPSGKPVPVESLENKILAVDVSIWLHQAIKGFQDAKGAPAVNAHLLGIFHRVCKLLYFKVKPVFVFDGGVPTLKKETIGKRNKLKHKNISEAGKIQKQLLDTLIKHSAVSKVLADKAKAAITTTSPTKAGKTTGSDDLFKLPETDLDSTKTSSDEEEDSIETDSGSPTKHWNLHNIDTKSERFKLLPADVRHEILTDLKETRKQSSWGRLHELPTQSDDFSGFQMRRLLKRQEVQIALEEAEKEMGGHSLSLGELEEILKDQGVISKNSLGNRIASDENTRYLYIRDIKQALEKARLQDEKKTASVKEETEEKNKLENDKVESDEMKTSISEISNKADLELEKGIQKAITLSLQDQPSSSGYVQKMKLSDYSFLENFKDEDFESEESDEDHSSLTPQTSKLTSAQSYMMEYSGLNPNEIAKIIASNEGNKQHKKKLNEIPNRKPDQQIAEIKEQDTYPTPSNTSENQGKSSENKSHFDLSEPELKRAKLIENLEVGKLNSSENINILSNILNEKSNEIFGKTKDSTDIITLTQMEEMGHQISSIKETDSNKIAIMSGSEGSDDDFNEVENLSTEKLKVEDNILEIKIEAEKFVADDDLFADIFTPKIEENQQKLEDKEELKVLEEQKFGEPMFNEIDKTIQVVSKISDEPKSLNQISEPSDHSLEKSEQNKLKENTSTKLTDEELIKMKNDLSKEQLELRNEQGFRERLGTNITDQMYKEAQDLLELFGLPYIVAPMEAEAQCAFLELASLTDGTITDDSDIWLFGGKTVYKNFFNQSKHVLEYRAEDIKHHFKLSREQMILLALLVGSDYTSGLQGVGPVTALEILAAFPSSSTTGFILSNDQLLIGLSEFKSWFMQGKTLARGKNSLRNKLKNVIFTDSFPSVQVVQAYLNPTVDTNEEKFSWSKPDFEGLTDFGRIKFGWSRTKTEEILKPVIKKMKESKYQSTLLNYFKVKHNLNAEEAQKLMSERVKSAIKRIGQDPKEIEDDDLEKQKVKKSKRVIKSENKYEVNEDFRDKLAKNAEKTKKSHSEENEDLLNKDQEKCRKLKFQDDVDIRGKKRTIGKRTEESHLKNSTGETKMGQGKKRSNKKVKAKEQIEFLSDDEFIDVDKLEALLETVENKANNGKKNKQKIKKTNKRSTGENNIKNAIEIKITNANDSESNNRSNEELMKHDNIHMAIESDKNFTSNGCTKKNKIEHNNADPSTPSSCTQETDDKEISLKIELKNNPEMIAFKYVSQLIKGKHTKKMKKEKTQKSTIKKTEKNKASSKAHTNVSVSHSSEQLDDELKLLKETEALSEQRIEEIKEEAEKKLQQELNKKKLITRKIHRKEIIPQRERDQKNVVRTRLRAIEVFRKSNIDPSHKKGTDRKIRATREVACLSESSSDSDL